MILLSQYKKDYFPRVFFTLCGKILCRKPYIIKKYCSWVFTDWVKNMKSLLFSLRKFNQMRKQFSLNFIHVFYIINDRFMYSQTFPGVAHSNWTFTNDIVHSGVKSYFMVLSCLVYSWGEMSSLLKRAKMTGDFYCKYVLYQFHSSSIERMSSSRLWPIWGFVWCVVGVLWLTKINIGVKLNHLSVCATRDFISHRWRFVGSLYFWGGIN